MAPWSSGLHCFQQEIYRHLYLCSSEINIFSSSSYLLCLRIVIPPPRSPQDSFVLVFFGLPGFVGLQFSFNLESICPLFLKMFFSVLPHLPYPSSGTPNTCVFECFKLSHSSLSAFNPSQYILYFRYYSFKF